MCARLTLVTLILAVVAGCGGSDPLDPDAPRRDAATQLGGMPSNASTTPPPPPPPPPSPTQTENQDPQDQQDTVPPGAQRAQATGREGRKGKGYGTGPIATPVAAYFSARGQINMIQVNSTLKIYKAEHGHAPKTNEEFMETIIKANSFTLPELPHGHRYVWDPKQEKLMVERPAR